MSENQQKLVLAIIDFLNGSLKDVKSDDKEGLEVASECSLVPRMVAPEQFLTLSIQSSVQCIGEAFGVDPTNDDQSKRLSVKPASLQNIFDVYLKTKEKASTPVAQTSTSASTSSRSAPGSKVVSEKDKAEAEKLKQSGNSHMSSKDYDKAIDFYAQAIQLDDTNPVYFSNRAAAYTSKGDYLSAIGDSEQALTLDSSFVKAYHRLGCVSNNHVFRTAGPEFISAFCIHRHAHYCLADYSAAASAFEKGLKLDPNNANLKSGFDNAKARMVDDDDDGPPPLEDPEPTSSAATAGARGMPDLASMASMFGGGGGGGGGMPDLSSMMNNPAMMQMAQQMAANGGLEKLMSNPAVMNMV